MIICMACPACGSVEEFEPIWWTVEEGSNRLREARLHCPRCEYVWTEGD